MPSNYKIFPDIEFALLKASGVISIDDVMQTGGACFVDDKWKNGYKILGDYRNATDFNPDYREISQLVGQDRDLNARFDKSKFAVVAPTELIFGISRMWENLSIGTIITSRIFKDLHKALDWLGMDYDVFKQVENI